MKNVTESLTKLIQEEDVADFNCEVCQRKVPLMKKRLVLNKMPPVVVLQCNRFVFNFETMQNEKLNTRYEFPRRVNLEPYSKEGLQWRAAAAAKTAAAAGAAGTAGDAAGADGAGDAAASGDGSGDGKVDEGANSPDGADGSAAGENGDDAAVAASPELAQYALHPKEYYEYKLKGVVVHNGTADHGHYYSYIREANPATDAIADVGEEWRTERWFRFDDTSVSEFIMSPDILESECFGGPTLQFETDELGNAMSVTKDQVCMGAFVYHGCLCHALVCALADAQCIPAGV